MDLVPILVLVFVSRSFKNEVGKFHCKIGFSSYNRPGKTSSYFSVSVQYLFFCIPIYSNPIAHHSNSTDADFMQED